MRGDETELFANDEKGDGYQAAGTGENADHKN
jgi:hypothetical protein